VAKAPADGYTLLGVAFPFGANPSIYKKMPYDTVKDFAPVIFAGQTPNLLVVRSDLSVHTVAELIAHVKAHPGKYSYGSAGIGSSNHLSMELFKSMARMNLVHVPCKGSAPMVNDLLGGHIDMAFDNIPNLLPQVNSGKLRAIAISSTKRSNLAPDVPTVSEAGLPGYEVNVWFGIVAPGGVPNAIIEKLNRQINSILEMPDVERRFQEQGVEPVGGTAKQFDNQIRTQIDMWATVVRDAGIQPE
jgi:tripartite-type tricarboxylate transporter receptor subunit TctC